MEPLVMPAATMAKAQEEAVVSSGYRGEVSEAEEVSADEGVGGSAEGKGKAEEVIGEGTGSGIEDVGEHDIHGVLGTNGAGA